MGKYDNLSTSEKKRKIEELKNKINKAESDYNFYKAMQLGLKLVLNGSYGAFCHPAFSVSNTDIANSITALAREVINFMLDHIEDYFYNKWGTDKDAHSLMGDVYISEREGLFYIHRKDGKLMDEWGRKTDNDSTGENKIMNYYYLTYDDIIKSDRDVIIYDNKEYRVLNKVHICDFSNVQPLDISYLTKPDTKSKDFDRSRGVRNTPIIIYGDTDSVEKNTIINTNGGEFSIEELYNKNIENGSAGNTLKGHESVNCDENVLNYSKEKELYYAPVKRIIRHKVTKSKWKLKTKSGKEIIVTNDHSMIVFRNGEQLEVKPCDILKTDKILCIKTDI